MSEHDIERRLHRLERIEEFQSRKLRQFEEGLELNNELLRALLRRFLSPPAAGLLSATFSLSGDPMIAILVATPPAVRKDGSTLSPTDIASITFQKTSLVGTPPAPGPQETLGVNTAAPGAGLTPAQITLTDTASAAGDAYTFFVTDTAGNVGDASNVETNPGAIIVPPPLSPPAAGTLAATFS